MNILFVLFTINIMTMKVFLLCHILGVLIILKRTELLKDIVLYLVLNKAMSIFTIQQDPQQPMLMRK